MPPILSECLCVHSSALQSCLPNNPQACWPRPGKSFKRKPIFNLELFDVVMGEHQNHNFYDLGNFECAIEPQNRSDSSLETPGWTINSKKIPKPFLGKWFLQFTQQCRASGVLESLGEAGAEKNDHPYNKLLKSLDMRKISSI